MDFEILNFFAGKIFPLNAMTFHVLRQYIVLKINQGNWVESTVPLKPCWGEGGGKRSCCIIMEKRGKPHYFCRFCIYNCIETKG